MTENTTQEAECLSHLTAELEALGWRHMDSAPKNDIRILLLYKLYDGFRVEIGCYFEREAMIYPQIGDDLTSRIEIFKGWNTTFCCEPIGWQPLPIPTSKL